MSSQRVLFTTTSGTGHLMPLVPVVEAAREAGHAVAVAAPEEVSTKVLDLGFECLPFGGLRLDDPQRVAVFERMAEVPESEIEALIGREIFGRINTTAALPGLLDAMRAWRPDVVVSDAGECAGSIGSEVLDVPWMRVTPTMTSLAGFDRHMASGLVELRAEHGLDDDRDGDRLTRARLVGYFPESFEGPADALADALRIRDPRLGSRETADDVVYVSFGTESSGMPFFEDLVRASIDAALQLGLGAVVAVGRGVDLARFGPRPTGVELVEWVDQAAVMARCRVVVCHAGAGTTLGALSAGVPIVAVPMFADQPQIAARVQAARCGVAVTTGEGLAGDLCSALSTVLASPPEGCERVRAEIAALAEVTAAVELIEQVAEGR